MTRPAAVVAQNDSTAAFVIADSLRRHFPSVHITYSLAGLREAIPRHRATIAVADLECMSVGDVEQLRREFPHLKIVCTHRLADERLWADALRAGASDCFYPSDVPGIVAAATKNARAASLAA